MRKISMKRFLALLMAISMIFSIVPITSYAGNGLIQGADKAKIELRLLQEDSSEAIGFKQVNPSDITIAADSVFYLGIYMKDFKNISEVAQYVKGSKYGLNDIAVGIAYNDSYVKIEPENNYGEDGLDGDAIATLWKSRMSYTDSFLSKPAKPATYSYASDMIDETEATTEDQTNGFTKKVDVSAKSSTAAQSKMTNYSGADDCYLAIVKFQMLSGVENAAAGTKLVGFSTSANDTSMSFGTSTNDDRELYQYSRDGATTDICTVVEFDASQVNFFPQTYTVSYYDSYDAATTTYGNHIANKDTKVTEDSSLSSVSGATLPTASDFTVPSGKFIDKWYYIPDGTSTPVEFTTSTKITADTKVYATYVDGHDVTFNSNYPTGTQTTKVVTVSPSAGATIAESQKPTVGAAGSGSDFEAPAGYTFKGWFTQANGGDEIVFDDGTNTSSATDVSATSDVYAQWTQNVTVTFHENFGQTENTTQKTLSKDANLTDSDIPTFTRTNYTFAGWNTKANGSGTKYTNAELKALTVSADADYYAMWEPTDKNNQVTLTFDSTGCDGAVSPTSISVVKGDTIYAYQMPTDPTKTSATGDKYTFEGWYEGLSQSNADKFDAPFILSEDKTAYAHWSYNGKDKVTVTFDYDGAKKPTTPTSISLGKGDTVGDAMPTNPVKDNYSFNKWVNTTDNSDFDKNTVVSADVTVKATYSSFITVNYDVNGGTGTYSSVTGAPTASYANPTTDPTRANYVFVGWNTKPNGSGTFVKSTDSYTYQDVADLYATAGVSPSNVTLYAYWADVANGDKDKVPGTEVDPETNGVKVTFDSNATGSNASTVTDANPKYVYPHLGDALGTMMPENPSRTHYKFVGWNTKADGTGTTFTNATAITANLDGVTENGNKYSLVVYAQWDIDENVPASDRVTLTFNDNKDGNGGSQVKTVTIYKGDSLGYDVTAPTNTGYSFDDWYEGTVTGGSLSMTSTKFNKDTKINSNTDYYAKWASNITIKYDVNGGTGTYNDVVGAPTDAYADPAQNPTKSNYVFIGWNTEPNGSGKFIKAADCATLNDVSLAAQGSAKEAPTTITLYAYWADANVTPGSGDIPNVNPNNDGVKVTFNSNVAGNKTNATVTDANPKYVYPHLGDTLGKMMPNAPTRTHYVFKGWSTTPSGKGGVTVDASTVIDKNTLGDALQAITGTNTAYEVTLYAQWDTDATANKVTVTFKANKKLDGTTDAGDPDANDIVINLNSGDSIGYDLPTITNGTFDFEGWNTSIDGKGTAFDKDAAVTADTTYYAYWFKWLKIDLVSSKAEYTGKVIAPKYNIYQVDKKDKTTKVGSNIFDNKDLPAGFTATITDNDNNSATIQNVGVYTIAISIDNSGEYARNFKIATNDSTFEVTPAKLTVNVDPATQKQKAGSTRKDPDITVVDASGNTVGTGEYTVKYYTWADAGTTPDGKIQKSELTPTTDITKVGKYVVAVELNANSNYVIDSVKSKTTESVVLYDGKTTGYVEYTDATVGQNIVYEVLANDPSIKSITANSVTGTTVDSNNLPFKDSKFENDVTFDNAENPTVKDYYVRVPDVDADSIQFNVTLTNPDTTTITASDGTVLTPTKNSDGTYTIKAPLTNKGQTENTITITTKAGTDADAPTLTYTFHVQQLVTPKITLNYGNSPVGLIKNMANATSPWASSKITEALNEFTTNNTYGANLVPDNGVSNITYTTEAWGGEVDPAKNMDRNDYAIFVYNKESFNDTGFTATDSLGNKVDVKRTITVQRMPQDSLDTIIAKKDVAETVVINDTNDKCALDKITENSVVPDIYTMTYSFTDSQTNQEVKVERPVVILWTLGDVDLSAITNPSDVTAIYSVIKGKISLNGLSQSFQNLYTYRIVDIDLSTIINPSDVTALYSIIKGKASDRVYKTN